MILCACKVWKASIRDAASYVRSNLPFKTSCVSPGVVSMGQYLYQILMWNSNAGQETSNGNILAYWRPFNARSLYVHVPHRLDTCIKRSVFLIRSQRSKIRAHVHYWCFQSSRKILYKSVSLSQDNVFLFKINQFYVAWIWANPFLGRGTIAELVFSGRLRLSNRISPGISYTENPLQLSEKVRRQKRWNFTVQWWNALIRRGS